MNGLKNRGVKDVLIVCADSLTGIKEATGAAFPKAEYQRCIVHQVRNSLKYVTHKESRQLATDLRMVYHAPNEIAAKWEEKYPRAIKSWQENWDSISPIFKFSSTVRKVIYTTNAIESLNSAYRKLNSQRSVFPSTQALLKVLYLATFEATKSWSKPLVGWGRVYGELEIMYEGRLP